MWAKKTFEFPIPAEKSLSILFYFVILCFKSPPTKIFWIRHWLQTQFFLPKLFGASPSGTPRKWDPKNQFFERLKLRHQFL